MRLSWVRTLGLPITLALLSATMLHAQGNGAAAYLRLAVGARPMGMGGAFVGLADDATAINFNVAGISAIPYREALAMHGALSFDRQYNHLALVVPNHRGDSAWGLSYTRFSVDGIPETRLIPGTQLPILNGDGTVTIFSLFDDVEDNLTISYAWKQSEQLRFGYTARLLHVDLFRDEANGFANDFGLLWQPTTDVRVGLSVKNVFGGVRWNGNTTNNRQRDRIDGEVVAGVAVRGWKDVLYLVDLFATEGGDPGVRFGLEKWWAGHYALRAGLNDGDFTIGASAKYQQMQFDYAFQAQDFGDINRVSLTYRW